MRPICRVAICATRSRISDALPALLGGSLQLDHLAAGSLAAPFQHPARGRPQSVPSGEALVLRGIVKTYGAVRANDSVDLTVRWGEIHALLGENGAGKTTLMNVVYGLTRPDAGEVLFDGRPVQVASPIDAIRLGIGMVHQHFMLIPPLTVAENVVLGLETARTGVMDVQQGRR